ncbi:uncharacterized protein LOC113324087 [Papaver somniferum]|uniref:uncharacterized protein LOC113324087 n=1 Tax=Papaver somniferum TaxID=3469 RepID=UPI000E6F723B|nr:uncharacterized protein LOC113324087 [Papaver somniferum]
MITRSKNGISKPQSFTAITAELMDTPTTFAEANKLPVWRTGMCEEIDALVQNGTWDYVPYRPGMNVVGCKWVFRVKKKADGTVERCKDRLVSKGYNQVEGIDYQDTFIPVVKPTTIGLMISVALFKGWSIRKVACQKCFSSWFFK